MTEEETAKVRGSLTLLNVYRPDRIGRHDRMEVEDWRTWQVKLRYQARTMKLKLEEFKKDCELRGMSHGSVLSYISSIRIFMQFLRSIGKDLEEVDKVVLKAYIDHLLNDRKVKYPTLESHFSALSALYDWMVFEEEYPHEPCASCAKEIPEEVQGRRRHGGEGAQAHIDRGDGPSSGELDIEHP